MPTVVLDAYSKAYPAITNRIRASVFRESDPLAPIATIIDTTPGHPARIWHFPGLPRENYGFSLDEIDGAGVVLNNLALFSVVPGQIDGTLTRNDEQIKEGVTPGFNAGISSIFFDGGETSPGSGIFRPDYIGWDIVPSELTGRGILEEGLDYSWNEVTGEFTWLQPGDVLGANQCYNIHFNPIQNPSGGSVPTLNDFSARVVTVDDDIEVSDFGNALIVEPDGVYLELQLPDILTVPQGRILTIEVQKALGTSVQCVKVIPAGSDTINFLRGNLFLMNNESVQIYRFKRDDDNNEWRVINADGNFKRVGETISEDAIGTGVYCKQALDGSSKDRYQYARIYEEYVLNLPSNQLVDYDNWATGNNKYLFSRANSSDPGNANKFRFPDRRGLFERSNNSGKSGDYFNDQMKQFWTVTAGIPTILQIDGTKTEIGTDPGPSPNIQTNVPINTTLFGSETYPKHLLINKYVLI